MYKRQPLYWALDLKYPVSVEGSSTLSNLYSPPQAQKVTYKFPARPSKGKVNMPELTVHWYDGGLVPNRPEELKDGEMMGDENGGIILIGTKGKIMTGCYGMNPTLLPTSMMNDFTRPEPTLPRVKGGNGNIWSTDAHEQDLSLIHIYGSYKDSAFNLIRNFLDCVKSREQPWATLEIGHRSTTMAHLGTIAMLTGERLEWDAVNERFKNSETANKYLSYCLLYTSRCV